jgi:hypothetical protein
MVRLLAIVAGIIAIAIAAWFMWPSDMPPPQLPSMSTSPKEAKPAPRGPEHPVEAKVDPALPALKQSDPAMVAGLTGLFGDTSLRRFFDPEDVIRRIVATVDNLPRESYATRLNPVKPIPGAFVASGREGSLALAPANEKRYAEFVGFAEGVDASKAVALYLHFYPLFQQAYLDLGYPEGYFNDRLVTVIDHLLAAPDVKGPVRLATPHVLYEYVDADLQDRSAGQKAMIRMGPDNAARLKAKLREVRAEIVKQSAQH